MYVNLLLYIHHIFCYNCYVYIGISIYTYVYSRFTGTMMWCVWRTFLAIPIGWAQYMAGSIFLRGGEADKRALAAAMSTYRKERYRAFCVFPEGAVFVPSVHKKSLEYAKKCVFLVCACRAIGLLVGTRWVFSDWQRVTGVVPKPVKCGEQDRMKRHFVFKLQKWNIRTAPK